LLYRKSALLESVKSNTAAQFSSRLSIAKELVWEHQSLLLNVKPDTLRHVAIKKPSPPQVFPSAARSSFSSRPAAFLALLAEGLALSGEK
jgi:hypothetical protein